MSKLLEYAEEIIFGNEGNYESVNKDDNGAVSVGRMQWHGSRASSLLRDIISKEPNAKKMLGEALYNELEGGADWSSRTVTDSEASNLKKLLGCDNGKKVQDGQMDTDVTVYIKKGESYGLKDDGALIYFADGVNQYGTDSSLWKTIAQEALKGKGDVEAMYKATLNHTKKYLERRKSTYEKILKLLKSK